MIDLANWFKCTIMQVYVWAFSIHSIVAKNTSNLILELYTVCTCDPKYQIVVMRH